MSRANKNKAFVGEGEITQEAMMAYLQNRLSETERQQFEKLLQDDPFAAEALEGLKTLPSTEPVEGTLERIRQNVQQRSGAKPARSIKLHWSAYAWAAAVLGLLVGIGFLMTQYLAPQPKEMAQAETAARSLPESEESAGPVLVQDAVDGQKEASGAKEPAANRETTNITTDVPGQQPAAPLMDVKKTEEAPPAGSALRDVAEKKTVETFAAAPPAKNEQALAEEVNSKTADTRMLRKQADENVAPQGAAPKTTATVTANESLPAAKSTATPLPGLDDAMKSFNAGDYKTAAEQFDAILKQNPDNAEALYFGGIAEYINGNNNKSEKQFDKLLKTGRYTDGSKWYKANILIKKGKKADAKKLLQELSATSGAYKERAVKKLEELEY